jgi:hypothetical protein
MPSESAELGVEVVAEGIDHEAQAGLPGDQSSSKCPKNSGHARLSGLGGTNCKEMQLVSTSAKGMLPRVFFARLRALSRRYRGATIWFEGTAKISFLSHFMRDAAPIFDSVIEHGPT